MPPSPSRVRARRSRDPLEGAIEAALDPGRFVSERAGFAFVSDLDEVAGDLARLVESEPERAAALYEAFMAGCQEKANEVDDSGGELGMFVAGLFQGWIRARQAMRASRDETAARLLKWMDDDQFGFTLDLPADAARVLDRPGSSPSPARFGPASRPVGRPALVGGGTIIFAPWSWPRRTSMPMRGWRRTPESPGTTARPLRRCWSVAAGRRTL
jgi:hypothetical protein